MKHVRVTATVAPEEAPAFFNLLANSEEVAEARVVDWNTSDEGVDTVLFGIEGDAGSFRDSATETPGIESVELSEPEGGWTYALVQTRPLSTPMFDTIHRARTRPGLIVRKPIVYAEGDIYFHVVGDPGPVQEALAQVEDVIDVRIDEIGSFRGEFDRPETRLTERQREALEVAIALDYYEQPRGATHEDVASELGCTPPTASQHLQKAEAKLVRAIVDRL